MVLCKNCGNEIVYTGKSCPVCKRILTFDKADVISITKRLEVALKSKKYEDILECYHVLADLSYKDAEIEYGKILEKGQLTPKNLDLAMKYFGSAAKKNDGFAAYKYSRLLIRENEEHARFWLIFSAILGYPLSYPAVAEEFENAGYEADATYFYSLAAASDDVYSIVTMAKRYYHGIGAIQNESYARWYMDKLRIPPVYAIKLAYKLRRVKASEPPRAEPQNYSGLLHRLAKEAKALGFDTAYAKLCEILFEKGDVDSGAQLGISLVKDDNCKQNFAKGMEILKKTASLGSIVALVSLGDIYSSAEGEEYVKEAVLYYKEAGELGSAEAYMRLGDMYYRGELLEQDIGVAVSYYDLSAKLGNPEALKKSDGIKKERESLYKIGLDKEQDFPEQAYRSYAIATAMGHPEATFRLALLYELGCGVKTNRHGAYLWYKKAEELGIYEATLKLGICYRDGFGVKRDFRLAREYISKAERLGVTGAKKSMQELMQRKIEKLSARLYSTAMRLIYQKKYKLSKTFLELSSDLLCPKAIYTLGALYEFGIGADYDRSRAYSLYEESASLGFSDTASRYKLKILKMIKAK